MQHDMSYLNLCAASLLLREPGQCGHMLFSLEEDEELGDEELRVENERLKSQIECGLHCGIMPSLIITQSTAVMDVAQWLYAADLQKDDDLPSPDASSGGSRGATSMHPKNRPVFLQNLHRASPEVQSCLIGVLQHGEVYGAGERVCYHLTVLGTVSDKKLLKMHHSLRERFTVAARTTPEKPPPLATQAQRLLENHPGEAIVKILPSSSQSGVFIQSAVHRYFLQCIRSCRQHPDVGLSIPSHSLLSNSVKLLRVYISVTTSREFATPEDVRSVIPHLLFHRLSLQPHIEQMEDGPILLPPSKHKTSYWSAKINEDASLGIANSLIDHDLPGSLRCAAYQSAAAKSSWDFVKNEVGRIPIPL